MGATIRGPILAEHVIFAPAGTVAADDVQAAIEEVSIEGGGGGGGPHAASHADLGADEVSIDASQITTGLIADARIPAAIARDTEVTTAVTAHEGAANPHPTYETSAEAQAKVDTHAAAADPHPGYLTPVEGNAAYEVIGAVGTHAAAADPHAGYRLESVLIAAADVAADVATQAELDAEATERMNADNLRVLKAGDTMTGPLGIGGAPNAKAILDLQSTTLGFLPPRMTTVQRDAIVTPPAGLVIFNTTTGLLEVNV